MQLGSTFFGHFGTKGAKKEPKITKKLWYVFNIRDGSIFTELMVVIPKPLILFRESLMLDLALCCDQMNYVLRSTPIVFMYFSCS